MEVHRDGENISSYKHFHESYMINLNGTTAFETYTLFVPSVLTVFLNNLTMIIVNMCSSYNTNKLIQFLTELVTLVMPVVLWVTVLSDYVTHIFIILLIVCAIITWWLLFQHGTSISISKLHLQNSRRHYITNARSTINLITVICILAVDFRIFPRRLAKTETFGFSLMDVGVGLYVFSNGIVTKLPTREIRVGFFDNLHKTLVSCIPLLILGSVRFVLTNELDYQQHVSEYGVHWNFFITLAVTKMLSSCILSVISVKHIPYITFTLLLVQQWLLSTSLQNWVFSNIKRSDFLSANREGVASSVGYVALYFLSICIANSINLKGKTSFIDNLKLLLRMYLISSTFLGVTVLCQQNFGVSRRLANITYCLWIIFIGTSMTTLFLNIELILVYIHAAIKSYAENQGRQLVSSLTPLIYDAINFNGLTFFLLANVLTGLINLTIHTLSIGPVLSLFVIMSYIFIICAIMSATFVQNIKLKFW